MMKLSQDLRWIWIHKSRTLRPSNLRISNGDCSPYGLLNERRRAKLLKLRATATATSSQHRIWPLCKKLRFTSASSYYMQVQLGCSGILQSSLLRPSSFHIPPKRHRLPIRSDNPELLTTQRTSRLQRKPLPEA